MKAKDRTSNILIALPPRPQKKSPLPAEPRPA